MRKLLTLCTLFTLIAPLAGCQPGGREVVVTRDQFGDAWPLQVNSAKVVCSDDDEAAYVRIGRKLYGLNADAGDVPPVTEVVRQIPVNPREPGMGAWPADPAPLLAACEDPPGDVASR